jgi:hypothetical protein
MKEDKINFDWMTWMVVKAEIDRMPTIIRYAKSYFLTTGGWVFPNKACTALNSTS